MTDPVAPTEDASVPDASEQKTDELMADHPDELATHASAPSPGAALERLEREGEIAADYLETLLDVTDLDGDIDVDIDGDRAAVAIVDSEEGRVPRRLVGRDGEVLEALQELTRLAVLAASGERSRLMLDIAGYRAGRREALVKRAQEVVSEVKSSGTRVALEPMTPFERKVVHDAVAAEGLMTESEGVEPERHVVVLPV
jgi:spoIIIJ-associated protein